MAQGKWDALVKKIIEAKNGMVVLSVQAEGFLSKLVANSGVIQAQGIKQSGGRIILTGNRGRFYEGEFDASSAFDQGVATVEGEKVQLSENSDGCNLWSEEEIFWSDINRVVRMKAQSFR